MPKRCPVCDTPPLGSVCVSLPTPSGRQLDGVVCRACGVVYQTAHGQGVSADE